MLNSLIIRNYALIEGSTIELNKGLTMITGETGAGKSILLGALGLLIGQRADSKIVRNTEKKSIVEAEFDIRSYQLHAFFDKHELDYDDYSTIRREVHASGKSRAFINDTPVNLQQLKEFGSQLVDIHSQHETLLLNNTSFQLRVIDVFAGTLEVREQFKLAFQEWNVNQKELKDKKEEQAKLIQERDFNAFLLNELEEANIASDELEELEDLLAQLTHAEEIKSSLHEAVAGLNDNETAVISILNQVESTLSGVEDYQAEIKALNDRLRSTRLELDDIAAELDSTQEQVSLDPEKLEITSQRINQLNSLLQKHRVQTEAELIDIQAGLQAKMESDNRLEEDIIELEYKVKIQQESLMKKAEQLHTKRSKAIVGLKAEVERITHQVGMPNAVFNIQLEKQNTLKEFGFTGVQFLFSANKGHAVQTLSEVASGGELSRVMLALKAISSKRIAMPTILFDEIDTGVSGDVALKMANVLKEMSQEMQVITISHLPQVAANGDAHFKVFKEDSDTKTTSKIKQLTEEERLTELAHMLSGAQLTEAALANARELMHG